MIGSFILGICFILAGVMILYYLFRNTSFYSGLSQKRFEVNPFSGSDIRLVEYRLKQPQPSGLPIKSQSSFLGFENESEKSLSPVGLTSPEIGAPSRGENDKNLSKPVKVHIHTLDQQKDDEPSALGL